MKKIIKLTESDLMRIVKRVINEQRNEVSFNDDTESVLIQIMDILKPIYKTYGMEGVTSVLTDILGTIGDIGDEAFMGPDDDMPSYKTKWRMPSDGEEDYEGEEGQAAATVVDWKEELKKANPKDILKELGYDDFLAEFAEFRKNGGDAYKYLEAKAFDWETVNHQDLVLDELKLQYPHLTDDKIEKLFSSFLNQLIPLKG